MFLVVESASMRDLRTPLKFLSLKCFAVYRIKEIFVSVVVLLVCYHAFSFTMEFKNAKEVLNMIHSVQGKILTCLHFSKLNQVKAKGLISSNMI